MKEDRLRYYALCSLASSEFRSTIQAFEIMVIRRFISFFKCLHRDEEKFQYLD